MNALPFLDLPIVQAPMASAATPELAAAVSKAGGLGSLGLGYTSPAAMRETIRATRRLTGAAFAVNLFLAPRTDAPDERLARANEILRPLRGALGIAQPELPHAPAPALDEQFGVVLEERPAVWSFTFGVPTPEMLEACKRSNIFTIGTATTVEEAVILRDAGVDAVCAQGYEAGGHRGTFLRDVGESLIGTLALVPQVVDAIDIPVVAAGGIGDGRGVAAVLALGACAAQIGSAFLLCDEAAVPAPYRRTLASPAAADTTLTAAFSGRTARAIRNRFTREMRDTVEIAPYPMQNDLTRDIRAASLERDSSDYLALWAGQAASLAQAEPAAATVARLMHEASHAAKVAHAIAQK